jgi:hypothetical protein
MSRTAVYVTYCSVCHVLQCMSRTAVFRWCSDFRHGRVSRVDMPRPGQAHVVITQESIAAVNSLVRENRRITTRKIADSLSVS